MTDFQVGLDKEKKLLQKMSRLGIREEDIEESFVRSRGPGGQKVNKTSTCVYLRHIPTGIRVKCKRERSQALNRYIAREILLNKIESSMQKNLAERKQYIEKIRRQKRKKPKALKLKILEEKRRHGQKKALRARVRQIQEV